MRTKVKNLVQDYDSRLRITSALNLRFHFSFLAFCLLAFGVTTEVSSEQQLDPTHLLVAYLVETSQNLDRSNITTTALEDMNTPSSEEETLQDVNAPNTLIKSSQTKPDRQKESQTGSYPIGAAAVSSTAELDNKSPQGISTTESIPNNRSGYQLWKTRMAAPENKQDSESKAELQRMIEQIRSIKFERINLNPEPVIDTERAPITQPDETLSDANTPSDTKAPEKVEKEQVASESENPLSYEPLTNQTLQKIKSLLQNAEQAENPFELAEVLFRSGHLKEASVFYQEALNRKNLPEPLSAQEKAWILFQIGNCLRNYDLPRAIKIYRQLILECPDSPWTDLAKVQEELISWHQKEEPRKLVSNLEK